MNFIYIQQSNYLYIFHQYFTNFEDDGQPHKPLVLMKCPCLFLLEKENEETYLNKTYWQVSNYLPTSRQDPAPSHHCMSTYAINVAITLHYDNDNECLLIDYKLLC